VAYYECDGCGYTLATDNMTTLELTYVTDDGKTKGKLPLHFHPVSEEHDCLRYFVLSAGIAKRQLKNFDMLSSWARELILSKVTLQTKR
jgi:hypothetical protein